MLLAALSSAAASAEPEAEPKPEPRTGTALLWSLIPGAGHIYLGDTGTGLTYMGLTGLALAGAIEVERRNDDLGPDRHDDELNVPLLVAD